MDSNQHLTVANLTQDVLVCCLQYQGHQTSAGESNSNMVLVPFISRTISAPWASARFELFLCKKDEYQVHLSVRLGPKAWQLVRTAEDAPWRIYSVRTTSEHFRILIIPKRDTSTFLSAIPNDVPLSSVLLPGTHDSMAFYGWPISQCQSLSTPLEQQLCSGIRFLDIRLSVIKDHLISYHGVFPQRTPFQAILSALFAFLSAPSTSRETIVVSIKQEDFHITPAYEFSLLVRDEIIHSPGGIDLWFLENRIPSLGEVRGKAVMFSRFGGDGRGWEGGLEGLGIHPHRWPDSEKEGFSWQCRETYVRTHDWYNISSFLAIPEKVTLAIENLILDRQPPSPILPITYFSAASFPLAFPTVIARGFGWPEWGLGVEGVNSRLGRWLLESLGNRAANVDDKPSITDYMVRGWTLLDFYAEPESSAVVPLLIECNFVDTHVVCNN